MVNTFEPLKIGVENNVVSHPEAESKPGLVGETQAPLPFHPLFRGRLTMHNDIERQ
jgi:hypothetical protein